MNGVANSNAFNGDLVSVVNHMLNIPESLEKFMSPSRAYESQGVASIPVDILDTSREYIFFMDMPGLSKYDIQTLVIRGKGKRKREEGEEEGCKYLRLERRSPQELMRKFRLPENANVSAITAKCENGVLTVIVEKRPPPPKSKTVDISFR